MRVLFASSLRGWGGGEEWFTRAPRALIERGHEVALAARRGSELAARARDLAIPVHEVAYGGVFDPRGLSQLHRALHAIDADVAVGNLDKEVGALAVAGVDRSHLALVARRGSDFPIRASSWNRWLYGTRVQRVLTNSPGIANTLTSEGLRLPRERVALIPNGLDDLALEAQERIALEADWPGTAGARIVSVGELSARKNPAGVLEALARIHTPWRLLWIGDGPEREPLERRIEELGLQERVRLFGKRPEARRWTAAADLLVFFSSSEGQPWAVLEAMVAGVPVVSSELPGLSTLLESGVSGWSVPAGNVDALAAAIESAVADPAEARRLGAVARGRAVAMQGESAIYDRLEHVLERTRLEARDQKRAVFLDRDGTLLPEVGWLTRPESVRLMPGVGPALRSLQKAGYALIVVSNQSAIGRERATVEQVRAVNARLRHLLRDEGIELAGLFICPHKPEDACDCRKPKPGLLLQARDQLGIELSSSWIIGDSTRDVGAGAAAGVQPILIATGWGGSDPEASRSEVPHTRVPDLGAAVATIHSAK